MIRIDDVISKVAGYAPPDAELDLLRKAYVYSATLHRSRFYPDGYPALQHALEVSDILADLRLDTRCVVAGMLHDVLEDSLTDAEGLREAVGDEVTGLVEELSRLTRASYHSSEASRAEHMREMILASTRDPRVILILLADRLQYLRAAEHLEPEARQNLAREMQAIYAPIAHRLGIHTFKAEMEDRAFEITEPERFRELKESVEQRAAEGRERIEAINAQLQSLLERNGISAEVLGRSKHLFSIDTKMRKDRIGLDRIYDLLATRIIVEDNETCYRVLGLIHAAYTPLPGRFKDYIALPKSNGYQSLHTFVFGTGGDIFEIQIRTREMHREAELGIAAHFAYKDGRPPDPAETASASWFRRLLENLEAGRDPRESLEYFERDLAPDRIFVFTPTGEVIKLPPEATAIDFAYAIHTEVGHHCTGAKVDGRMVPIRTKLQNGQVVEILTSKTQQPHKNWLKFAVTSRAMGRIRQYLRNVEKQEAVRVGRDAFTREAKRLGKRVDDLLKSDALREWMKRNSIQNVDDLYAAEGFGRISLRETLDKLFGEGEPGPRRAKRSRSTAAQSAGKQGTSRTQVRVAGMEDMMVRYARCCSPVYGDPVVGIITRGRGVSVHHRDCRNLSLQTVHEGRVVKVDWVDENRKERPVNLMISTDTSMKELVNLISLLEEEEGTPTTSGKITAKKGVYTQYLTLKVRDTKQLKRILNRLNGMDGIYAERVLDSA